jgi:mono/diheme cytochrome c family protein
VRAHCRWSAWGLVVTVTLTAGASGSAQGTLPMAPPLAGRAATSTGAELFNAHCGACHGPRGKGDGPAASALRVRPPNLTGMTRDNGGTFPQKDLEWVLRFGAPLAAHGSSEMPVWGETFRLIGDEASVRYRIAALLAHLETLQEK